MVSKYYELVVKGDEKLLRGFVWGFKMAKNIKNGLIFCKDAPIETHHMKELLAFRGNYVHLIASEPHRKTLLAALEQAEALDIEIMSDHVIKNAYFTFKFETFNRDVAKDVKRLLAKLPAGVELVDYIPKEVVDPTAAGAELYSPVHDYIFSGTGKIQGDIEKALSLHRKLKAHVFVEVKSIVIDH